MATVLILATDQMIGGLLGQLTDLAGHSAQFRRDGEEPSEAVRHSHPDVVMLDTAYGAARADLIAEAAAHVGAPIVYFAAAVPANELRRFALERGAKYFALPAGPKLLRAVLSSVLEGDVEAPSGHSQSVGRYAVAAAAAAAARAHALADRAAEIKARSITPRAEYEATLADCRRSYGELREAIIAYTRELRGAGVPPDRVLEMVKTAVESEATEARANVEFRRALDDAVEWCLQAYYAA
jgi:DNA-binding response OmpR family regulator